MFELEDEAEKEHRNLGKLLTEKKFNSVYLCGKLSQFAKEGCATALYFESKGDNFKAIFCLNGGFESCIFGFKC